MTLLFGRIAGLVTLSLAAAATFAQSADLELGCQTVDWSGATSQPVPVTCGTNKATGHYYEVYAANGIAWVAANDNAALLSLQNVQAHLATITSSGEDEIVEELRIVARNNGLGRPEIWVGGRQEWDSSGPGSGWSWVNGEGDISTPQVGLASYSNWLTNTSCNQAFEPNDCGSASGTESNKENHLAIGLSNRYGWNDEGALGNIGGYIVEYDLPRSAACEPGDVGDPSGTCKTIEGQTIVFPGDLEGKKIGFSAYEFTDPRVGADGTCEQRPLRLFADRISDPTADSFDEIDGNTLIIPPYLCGSPKFVAVRIDSEDLSITSGTVLVENFTETVLPDNEYPDGGKSVCEDPIVQDPVTDGDPQYQDVVVWQSTDPGEMREFTSGISGSYTGFDGAAGEFTDSCGSSRAKVFGASYFVVGMRIDFGPGNTWAGNSAGNHEQFIALTRYKLELLLDSINESRSTGALLKNGDFNKMESMVVNAIKFLDTGDLLGALGKVENFAKFITPALYRQEEGVPNYEGEHISRANNIAFMLRVKVIPYD